MIDPRRVKLSKNRTNLTIIYTENGLTHQIQVASMNSVDNPLSHFTMTGHTHCWGIYNELGEEVWPSDCEALRKELDSKVWPTSGLSVALKAAQTEVEAGKAKRSRKS
jgi:hypothetical protein